VRDTAVITSEYLRLREIVRTLLSVDMEPTLAQLEGLYLLRVELDKALDRR
jgi:hypothetical protein